MYKQLINLQNEMKKYHRDKSKLDEYYIHKRLNESLNSYYKDLEYSLKYLNNRQPENVLKKWGE